MNVLIPMGDDIELDFSLEYALSATIGIRSYCFSHDKMIPAEGLIALMYEIMENAVMKRLLK